MTTSSRSVGAPPRGSRHPRWLDPVEMSAWRGYIESVGALGVVLEADLAPRGLTMGDYEVLVRLSEADQHQMRMCDLAAELRLSPSGLTRRLDGLVSGKLVRREPSSCDRRVMLATLTDRGLHTLEAAAPDHVEGVRTHFLDLLTRGEIEVLARVFTKLRESLGVCCKEAAARAEADEAAPA
jgi:DNA-binding MarR family transcriptional regulator